MTVSSTTSKNTYSGDGSTTVFAYTFRILVNTDIAVQSKNNSTGVITTKTLGTDYTVSNVGASSGGNVTFTTAPVSGTTIILIRSISILQPVHLSEYDPFASMTVETEFDRLTMISQQINELIGRGLVLDPTVTGYSNIIGSPTPGYVIRANSAGTGFEFAAPLGTSGYTFGSGTGILVQSISGTTALVRSIAAGGSISVTNGDGVSGNPTVALSGTPALGAATATTINKITFTQPASGATLTITDGKTLTVSNNATVSGTNTGDQTITLTGAVTGSGTGSIATTKQALNKVLSSSCASYTNASSSLNQITNFSNTITTTGRGVRIAVVPDGTASGASISMSSNGSCTFTLKRDGSVIGVSSYSASAAANSIPPSAIEFYDDAPTAASHTYILYTTNATSTIAVNNCCLLTYEL
jgi:hypothetical protein